MSQAFGNLNKAAGGNQELLNVLQKLTANLMAQNQATGTTIAIPPTCSFVVSGIDGKFLISITLPTQQVAASIMRRAIVGSVAQQAPGTIFHQLRSSTTVAFNADSGVTVYGPSAQVQWEIQDPNQTKFWELRSSYDQKNWNAWAPYVSPVVCGILPVWSGLLRSLANTMVNQATSYTGNSPLSQSGTSTVILVAASVWNAGSQSIAYLPGSVDPGSFGLFYVYADDPTKAGGSVVFVATQNVADLVAVDGRIYFGNITTSGAGGGSGGGGGGGACVSGDSLITMWDGSKRPQRELWRGDRVRGIDGEIDNVVDIEMHAGIPCFINEFDNGIITHAFSSRHPLKYSNAGFGLNFDILPGEEFTVENGVARLKRKALTFPQTVYAMTLHRSFTFWADGVGSHNARFMGK